MGLELRSFKTVIWVWLNQLRHRDVKSIWPHILSCFENLVLMQQMFDLLSIAIEKFSIEYFPVEILV